MLNFQAPKDATAEIVMLVVRKKPGAHVPAGFKLEVTKQPFHKRMGVNDAVAMSRSDANWHVTRAEHYHDEIPVYLQIVSVKDAEAENARGGDDESDTDDANKPAPKTVAKMNSAEMKAYVIENKIMDEADANVATKAVMLAAIDKAGK